MKNFSVFGIRGALAPALAGHKFSGVSLRRRMLAWKPFQATGLPAGHVTVTDGVVFVYRPSGRGDRYEVTPEGTLVYSP
jgi:hypothetical protein